MVYRLLQEKVRKEVNMRACIRHNRLMKRKCPICNSNDLELLAELNEERMGRKFNHFLSEKLSICKECGFIFASPSIGQDEFNAYYNDQITYFNAEETYSIYDRIKIISRYLKKEDVVAEIGGNLQGRFRRELETMCSGYYSFDINESARNTIAEIDRISVVDVLVSYYVLEHIVDLNEFIDQWKTHLKEGGYFIIEVPDANKYYYDTAALSLTEHVNHFTPESLGMLMNKHGFDIIEINRRNASRSFGFVCVLKKCRESLLCNYEKGNRIRYQINKSLIQDGLVLANKLKGNLSKTVRSIHEYLERGGVFLGCASNLLHSIYEEYIANYSCFKGVIIDEDIRKKEFDLPYEVFTSKELLEKGGFETMRTLVICSEERVKSVLDTLEAYEIDLEKISVFYIDGKYMLKSIN